MNSLMQRRTEALTSFTNEAKRSFEERDPNFLATIEAKAEKLMEEGRLSVLEDFDAMCAADAFVGFTETEWAGIKKFFAFNKAISGWDKPTTNE